jgi:hypothetical protein
VVVKDDLERSLDVAATQARRAELGKHPRSMIEPTKPAAGTWTARHMGSKDRYIEAPTSRDFSKERA